MQCTQILLSDVVYYLLVLVLITSSPSCLRQGVPPSFSCLVFAFSYSSCLFSSYFCLLWFFMFVVWMHRFPYSSLSWLFVLISVSECLPTFFSSLVFACSYLCCLLFSSSVCSLFILLILVRRLTCSLLFVVVVLVARLDLRWGVSWSLVSFSSLVFSVSYFPLSFFLHIYSCLHFILLVRDLDFSLQLLVVVLGIRLDTRQGMPHSSFLLSPSPSLNLLHFLFSSRSCMSSYSPCSSIKFFASICRCCLS